MKQLVIASQNEKLEWKTFRLTWLSMKFLKKKILLKDKKELIWQDPLQ